MKTFCYRRFSPFNLYLFSTISLLYLISWSSIQVTAQDSEQPIIINEIPKHLPLKVELIDSDKKEVLKHLKIKVTNTGEKPIYLIRFTLQTKDLKSADTGYVYGFPLDYNGSPNAKYPLEDIARPGDKPLRPNESYVFQIKEKKADSFKRGREQRGEQYPNTFVLKFQWLTFGDGTGFYNTSGKPFSSNSTDVGTPSFSNTDPPQFPFVWLDLFKLEEPRSCGSSNLKRSGLFKFFSTSISTNAANSTSNTDDGGIYCCQGNQCEQVRIQLEAKTCCVDANTGEPTTKVNQIENAPGFSCKTGYRCAKVSYETVTCEYPELEIEEYGCDVNPTLDDCNTPPPPPPNCTPTGHGEGDEGYDFECSDKDAQGRPIDNDCDGLTNCEEVRCRRAEINYCKTECDKDGDGINNADCGGDDCRDDNFDIPLRNLGTGQRLQEENQLDCNDGKDNDCDETADLNGGGGLPPDPSCPTPTPTPTPDPTVSPTPGDGGGDCLAEGCGDCMCNDCVNGCPDDDENCGWVDVPGECYAGVYYGNCWDKYGVLDARRENCQSEPPSCDPDRSVYVCE